MLWSSAEEAVAAAGRSPLSSPILPGKAGELGRSNPRCTEPCSLSVLRAYRCIRVYIYVCVCVCGGYIHEGKPQAEPWGAPALSARGNRPGTDKTKPKGTLDGISQDFPLPPKFLYRFPTRRRGRFSWVPPAQPMAHVDPVPGAVPATAAALQPGLPRQHLPKLLS